ncbi:dynamin family protein [Bacillus carboniphilus]|uniref:Dynamin family protein n=1 Tax=Bacillus carboniphilus TaxID=86663 RepID=A0ABP3GP43_9BACI
MRTSAYQTNLFSQYSTPLDRLSKLAMEQQNEKMVFQLNGLMDRLEDQKLYIAFCGHYSAGKSSLLNQMFHKNILPSSPIPTSANTVKMSNGQEEKAIISYKNGSTFEQQPLDFDEVKRLCKNGDEVLEVEIQTPYPEHVPHDLVFFDTPGIDSTDDAHQLATEGMLHLADLVFYMVDYHHVQSDINLQFIKQLNRQGKKVCLIVNQIDKHSEDEIRFDEFKQSTSRAFENGGAKLERLFFTSIKDMEHPNNEWNQLQTYLESIERVKEEWLLNSFQSILMHLTQEWEQYIDSSFNEQIEPLQAQLGGSSVEQLNSQLEKLKQQSEQLKVENNEIRNNFETSLSKMLHNSYLMDFETRDLANSYLESLQDGFKVGMLFSKKKTQEEKDQREEVFYNKLKEQAQTQFEWHLKQLAQSTVTHTAADSTELKALSQQLHCELPKEVLIETYKAGASLTGQYLLQYSRDLENEVKKIVQKEARRFIEQLLKYQEEKNKTKNSEIQKEIKQITEELNLLSKIEKIQEKKSALVWQWQNEMETTSEMDEQTWDQSKELVRTWLVQHQSQQKVVTTHEKKTEITDKTVEQVTEANRSDKAVETTKNDSSLHEVAEIFRQLPSLQKVADSIQNKANRLDSHTFTVTLFGAFSAGKSSFINGLLGEKILPSSPNPMTAALTEIKAPPTKEEHLSLRVHYKTDAEMVEELSDLIQIEGEVTTETIWKSASKTQTGQQHPFLKAFVKGYEERKDKLGNIESSTFDQLPMLAAEESVSCFIKRIELFLDHPLTNLGMTLVDTPGSDSLNTRHTGVAFEHIKNSDAIIYVTYYHHAFGKADREFLIQLGRVKDAFSLDKMFFVVNAADLADSEEEREEVVDYVKDQLLGYGLRHPRLFPVSSLNRLMNQTNEDSAKVWDGFNKFEDSFLPFVEHDLKQVTRQSAWKEVERGINILQSYVDLQNKSELEKEEAKRNLQDQEANIIEKLKITDFKLYESRLEQETRELVHYVKERVRLRARDFFKESFHPSRLQDDSGKVKEKLQQALQEWLELMSFDLIQELRATSLRLEVFVNQLKDDYYREVGQRIRQVIDIPFAEPEEVKIDTPDITSLQNNLSSVSFQSALQVYKNAKSFFEKNEKEKMLERLLEMIQQPLTEYSLEKESELFSQYSQQLLNGLSHISSAMEEEAKQYIAGQIEALSSDGDVRQEQLLEQLRNLS